MIKMGGFGRKGLSDARPAPNAAPLASRALKFDVTPSPWKMLLGIFFFGTAALICFVKMRDPRGLLINHLIELGPVAADIFWAILIALIAVMVGLSFLGFVRSFGARVFLTLDENAISGPANWNGVRTVLIDYRAIRNLKHQKSGKYESVVIVGNGDRKIKVGMIHFRDESQWSSFIEALQNRI